MLAMLFVAGANYDRLVNVGKSVKEVAEQVLENEVKVSEDDKGNRANLIRIFKKEKEANRLKGMLDNKKIESTFRIIWASNTGYVAILTIFPFVLLGWGFAFRIDDPYLEEKRIKINIQDLLAKYIVGFIIAFGWLYFFNPMG